MKLRASAGAPVHSSGGERSSPSQVKRRGIVAPSTRALEPSRMDRLHRYGAAGRVHLCRAKDWCCPNSIEAVRIARLLAERRAQNLGLNKQNSSRFFVTSCGVPLGMQKLPSTCQNVLYAGMVPTLARSSERM